MNFIPLQRQCRHCRTFSSQTFDKLKTYIMDYDRYSRAFIPSVNTSESTMLKNLKTATRSDIPGSSITRILLPKPLETDDMYSDVLYVRPFYEDLLKAVRSRNHSLLIGNPGTAKSFFQYYYLARIYNAGLYGALPPDSTGSCDPPEVVVRQVGKGMQVYFIKEAVAHQMDSFGNTIFNHFDRSRTLYFFEPSETKDIPMAFVGDVPSLGTMSGDERRYEELQKKRGVKKWYMPVWTEEELQVVGNDMRQRMESTSALFDFFCP